MAALAIPFIFSTDRVASVTPLSYNYGMSTSGPAEQLFHLQGTDTGVEQASKAISQLEKQVADNSVLTRARTILARAEQQQTELTNRQRELEMDDADLSAKVKTIEGQLYGGKVGNPKELANLQHEADILKAKLNTVEDGVLEVMERLEKAGVAVTKSRASLKTTEAAEQQNKQAFGAELKTQQDRLAALTLTRAGLVGDIEPALLSRYDRLRAAKGLAVAAVERGICQGCRVALFDGQMRQVRAGHLVSCDNCGRYLHLA
jgi:predicted  nucleic acid-binding Zn-ribbon protein